jgi:hypothetical protein
MDEAGGWGGGDGDYWVEWVYVIADDLGASAVASFIEKALCWGDRTDLHSAGQS